MKRLHIYLSLMILAGFFMNSCSKGFLDVDPKGTTLEANYYKNADEAYKGLIACYDPLGTECGKTYSNKIGPLNSASDDCYAGGGSSSDVPAWQVWNNFTIDAATGIQGDFWNRNFTGVYRANILLSKLPAVPGMSTELKARFTAECKFLRAYFYFDLVRLFKNVPLFTAPVAPADFFNVTQATPEAVWAQIEKDLNEAIPDLPATLPDVEENGRATKMAATALLGKVILFQNDESRMQTAADLFELVNTSPDYQLLADYGMIFRPDNKFNTESIFEIAHTAKGLHGWEAWPNFEGNVYTQMVGPRAYTGPTYKVGWGFNPITPELVNVLKNDPRYKYTVINIDSMQTAGLCTYEKGYQNTGYFVAKFAPLEEFYSTIGGDPVLNYPNNVIEIRLADTYLMEAEALVRANGNATKAQYYLDAVRARVGLPSIPATLENIYKERRLELATEGHRFFDLVRTGQAATVLASKGFTANKNEILPIPLAELTNTKLKQNPNY